MQDEENYEEDDEEYDSENDEDYTSSHRRAMNFQGYEYDGRRRLQSNTVDRTKPFILYLDSMNNSTESLMEPLRTYIEMEYLEKKMT